ncbi:MAG: BfmA/BtgA family mobilization protein [Pricia sp.]
MGNYANIKLIKATAERFRIYAQKLAGTQSEVMETLIDSHLRLLKNENGKSRSVQLLSDRSDMNANRVIGLIRKIEKEQIEQILGMLKVLFGYSSKLGGVSSKNEPVDNKVKDSEPDYDKAYDFLRIKEEKLRLAADLEIARQEFHELLKKKTEQVKPIYGKPYIKLLISVEDLQKLIVTYKPKH